MSELLTIENIANLGVLMFLQAVLGFDNLLYISIESQRAPAKHQAAVRRAGIIIAVTLRIVLLGVMVKLLDLLTDPLLSVNWTGVVEGSFNFASIVFLFGGVFIIYTAVKEISHLLSVSDVTKDANHSVSRNNYCRVRRQADPNQYLFRRRTDN